MVALDGCFIARSRDGNVEVVEAIPAHRAFPARVTESLGICLKIGPGHWVVVDGKELWFPEDTICIRRPGCVWSTAGTGPVGFVSLDIDPCLLPSGLSSPAMTFARNNVLPNFSDAARAALRVGGDRVAEVVGSLLFALDASGALAAEDHFTRLFKRVVGTTPGRYARSACARGAVPLRTFVQEAPTPFTVRGTSCKLSPSTATAVPSRAAFTSPRGDPPGRRLAGRQSSSSARG